MITTVLASNPGPMTLDGTNTYVITGAAGRGLVIDPGPTDPIHAARIRQHGEPGMIVLTHRHLDHSESAAALARSWSVPVRAADPAWCVDGEPLVDLTELGSSAVMITVISTPGHTDDSICLLVQGPSSDPVLVSGDTILGRGTTVITRPEGDLGAYLASLQRLAALVSAHGVVQILPGHGPVITDPGATIQKYLGHRRRRLDQVRSALAGGANTDEEVVDLVYVGLNPALRPAAVQSVRAQLDHLRRTD